MAPRKVVLSGRREAAPGTVATRIREAGVTADVATLDVSDKDAVHSVAADIEARLGCLDVLVNSAGLNSKTGNWHSNSLEDWDLTIRVDLDGAFYCMKAVLPLMKAQGDGLIINISSWTGKNSSVVTGPAYSAAKHARNAMSETLNMEACTFGVRCCAVSPGEVSTPILDNRPILVSEEDRAKMVQAEDMGCVILFLAQMPAHVCINDMTVSPAWNRGYVPMAKMLARIE